MHHGGRKLVWVVAKQHGSFYLCKTLMAISYSKDNHCRVGR
jgi:hypothetical protein